MLRVGLTGGIGAGKSTVARRFAELGATVVDADKVAREVVEPGTPGLAALVEEFGGEVLDSGGALDRPALASIVFGDEAARARLNGILHPLIGRRTAELVADAPADGVLVHDVPLLVEAGMGAAFHLVVVVHADVEERVRRLTADRGMAAEDARARIRAQADEPARRAAADVWLNNSGAPEEVRAVVDKLWHERLVPFAENVRSGRRAPSHPPRLVEPDPTWPAQYARLAARIGRVAGDAALRVDHVGSTSVPGLPAKDVIDIQLGVASLDAVADLRAAGFAFRPEIDQDGPKPTDPDPELWRKRYYTSMDPARQANLHVRVIGSPGWRYALLFRDWLRAEPAIREEYLQVKRRLAAQYADEPDTSAYAEAKEPWFDSTYPMLERWATETEWRIPEPAGAAQNAAPSSPKV